MGPSCHHTQHLQIFPHGERTQPPGARPPPAARPPRPGLHPSGPRRAHRAPVRLPVPAREREGRAPPGRAERSRRSAGHHHRRPARRRPAGPPGRARARAAAVPGPSGLPRAGAVAAQALAADERRGAGAPGRPGPGRLRADRRGGRRHRERPQGQLGAAAGDARPPQLLRRHRADTASASSASPGCPPRPGRSPTPATW